MNWPAEPVRVRVPATSANLGPGFDALGLALGLHDVVTAAVTDRGLSIKVAGVGVEAERHGEDHLVVRAMRAGFEAVGMRPPGLALTCENAIWQGFGLGSSAGAIVAGLVAARALCGRAGAARLPDPTVLDLATRIEGHADNVAACLAGGLTIAWSGPAASPDGAPGSACCVRLEPAAGLTPVLCVPATPLSTRAARAALPDTVPHGDAAANSARTALLIAALTGAGPAPDRLMLLAATEDYLHQSYRARAMPRTVGLVRALRAAGLPAVISGAGPSVLVLTMPGVTGGPAEVADVTDADGGDWTARTLTVDREGATLIG